MLGDTVRCTWWFAGVQFQHSHTEAGSSLAPVEQADIGTPPHQGQSSPSSYISKASPLSSEQHDPHVDHVDDEIHTQDNVFFISFD